MANNPDSLTPSLTYYLFNDCNKDFDVEHVNLASIVKVYDLNNLFISDITDRSSYGAAAGLYYIWKNAQSEYIGFSLDDKIAPLNVSDVCNAQQSGVGIICSEPFELDCSLLENYSRLYYAYDVRVMMSALQELHPAMYECAEDIMRKRSFIVPAIIMRKDIYRRFCLWLFPLLSKIKSVCIPKKSVFQKPFLEYITQYLINIYIEYNREKIKVSFTEAVQLIGVKAKEYCMPIKGDLIEKAQKLLADGFPEKIAELVNAVDNDDQSKSDNHILCALKRILIDYDRQRRILKETDLDRVKDINELIAINNSERIRTSIKTKRVLFADWNAWNAEAYQVGLEKLGFEVVKTPKFQIYDAFALDSMYVYSHYIKGKEFAFVFSVNHIEPFAIACYGAGIPYISWSYDSPCNLGDRSLLKYDTTNVFLFDRMEADIYKYADKQKNVNYMPLAIDCEKYDAIIPSEEDKKKYTADVSFVGRMYKTSIDEYVELFGDYRKAFSNGLMDYSVGIYDGRGLSEALEAPLATFLNDDRIIDIIYETENKKGDVLFNKSLENVKGRVMAIANMNVTQKERLLMVSLLSKHYNVKLYSSDEHELLKDVSRGGFIDYNTVMPLVFKLSKINLNISLKCIRSGIPLRCLDVMGCGGFLLSNYQQDFDDDFVDGKNIALYRSIEEAYDKCEYYLAHEEERIKIAKNGYETVRDKYNFQVMFTKILNKSGLGYLLG